VVQVVGGGLSSAGGGVMAASGAGMAVARLWPQVVSD